MSLQILNPKIDKKNAYTDYYPYYRATLVRLNNPNDRNANFLPPLCLYTKEDNSIGASYHENSRDWAARVLNSFLVHDTRPWFLLNGDSDVLSRIQFHDSDLEHLRTNPIAVYMYEPLFFEKSDGECHFTDSTALQSTELDSVVEFNKRHGENLDITVYTCEYDFELHLKRNPDYSALKFKTLDSFCIDFTLDHQWRLKKINLDGPPSKKAICLNYRFTQARALISAYLKQKNYLKETHLTYFHNYHENSFSQQTLGFDPQEIPQWEDLLSSLKALDTGAPYTLDTENNKAVSPVVADIPDLDGASNLRGEGNLGHYYADSYVSLVNETRFWEPRGIITEKTLMPIFYEKPFVVIGSPYLLRYLKELGFKTFSEFWDESYDTEEDPFRRLEKIFALIDFIFSMSPKQLHHLCEDMNGILEYNYWHLRKNFLPQQLRLLLSESVKK